MPTGLYVKGKENLGKKNIDLIGDTIVAILVDTSLYTIDLDNDEFQSDIPPNAVVYERTLTAKTFVDGVFDADDVLYPSLVSDLLIGAVILVQDTGVYSTSKLLFAVDNSSSFPIQPDGTDFTVSWDDGSNKIFKL